MNRLQKQKVLELQKKMLPQIEKAVTAGNERIAIFVLHLDETQAEPIQVYRLTNKWPREEFDGAIDAVESTMRKEAGRIDLAEKEAAKKAKAKTK